MKETDKSEIYGNEYCQKLNNNNKVATITVDNMTTADGDGGFAKERRWSW
jgi:hypothetical protein